MLYNRASLLAKKIKSLTLVLVLVAYLLSCAVLCSDTWGSDLFTSPYSFLGMLGVTGRAKR